MMLWNAGFVRGLAESVLQRARVIRSGLVATAVPPRPKRKKAAKKAGSSRRKPASRRKPTRNA